MTKSSLALLQGSALALVQVVGAVDLDKRFDAAADAVAYASPCTAAGYSVDTKAISREVAALQRDAVAQGITEQEAGDRLRESVTRKIARLNEWIAQSSFMAEYSESQGRYYRRLKTKCAVIAEFGRTKSDR